LELTKSIALIYIDALTSMTRYGGADEGKLVIARTPHSALRCAIEVYDQLFQRAEGIFLKMVDQSVKALFTTMMSPPLFLVVRSVFSL
jgi:hypothetical protein